MAVRTPIRLGPDDNGSARPASKRLSRSERAMARRANDLNTATMVRRAIRRMAPNRPPLWLRSHDVRRIYGFLEWCCYRLELLAMELEDIETDRKDSQW
jgi:hypothetical protein